MKEKQKVKSVFSKKELFVYRFVSTLMLALSFIVGGQYIGYVVIYLFLLWIAIYLLSRSSADILDRVGNFTVMVLLISPVIVYLLTLVIDIILEKYPSFLIIEGTKDTWINFAGSIIGGSMTMFALVFTLQHNKKLHDENQVLTNMPLMNFDFQKNDPEGSIVLAPTSSNFLASISISNISDNHSRNVTIVNATFIWSKVNWSNMEETEVYKYTPIDEKNAQNLGLVAAKGSTQTFLPLYKNSEEIKSITVTDDFVIWLFLTVKFSDIVGKGQYEQTKHFKLMPMGDWKFEGLSEFKFYKLVVIGSYIN